MTRLFVPEAGHRLQKVRGSEKEYHIGIAHAIKELLMRYFRLILLLILI